MAGAGEAVQTNARTQIKAQKEAALMDLRNRYAMQRQNDQQQFTAGENQADRQLRRDEGQADRQQRANLAAQQQAGAQSRTNAGGWTVVPKQGGGYQRFNTITGETGDVPEGINPTGGQITKRQELMFKQYGDQIEQIDKRLNDSSAMLDDQQRAELKAQRNRLESQQQQIIGMQGQQGGGDLASRLANQLNLPADGGKPAPQGGQQGSQSSGQNDNFQSAVERTQQNRQAQQAQQQTEQRQARIESQVDDVTAQVQSIFGQDVRKGLLGISSRAVGMSDADKQQKGRELLNQMRALYNDPNTSEFQRRRIAEQLDTLANAGISIEDF